MFFLGHLQKPVSDFKPKPRITLFAMSHAIGLYELWQHGATYVQAPRCHHTAIPQCVAPTHSEKKNPALQKNSESREQSRACLNYAEAHPVLHKVNNSESREQSQLHKAG